jgi:hypothetical protein
VNFNVTKNITFAGLTFSESNRTITSVNGLPLGPVTVAAAKIGSLTTRTDNTTGTLTMNAGHGFATGNRIDLFWATGCRVGVVVGTVATNSVPISGGNGDNLPTAATAITAMKPTKYPLSFVGDDVDAVAMSASATGPGAFTFVDGADAHLAHFRVPGGTVYSWDSAAGQANPLAGLTPVSVYVSQGDSAATSSLQVGVAV